MNARNVMTTSVVSVLPDTTVRQIAQTLLRHNISAVPVIDADGTPIGMVSEGDLIGRKDRDGDARRDWWLSALAEGEPLNPAFVAELKASETTARSVMATPLISVSPETDVGEIARLLATYRFKRVPVIENGHIAGIVSRADLLRCLATEAPVPDQSQHHSVLGEALVALDTAFDHGRQDAADPSALISAPASTRAPMTVETFHHLVNEHDLTIERQQVEAKKAAIAQRKEVVDGLIGQHIADAAWQAMLDQAQTAASKGEKEHLLLRFPAELCSDGGRAINAPETDWPSTLRGVAAEVYLRWERDLKPQGFHLSAQVLDFPGGFPGDIGLTLYWGE